MRRLAFLATGLSTFVLACGAGPDEWDDWPYDEELGTDEAAIVNGSPDTTHTAVVFLALAGGYGCSGTFIEASGNYAWVLTAAHCVTPNAPQQVIQGYDIQDPDTWYSVDHYSYHPAYSGQGSAFDIGVVRVWNTGGTPPMIPAATSPDGLGVGTQIRHVGYGLTSYPNGYNDYRNQTVNVISGFQSSDTEFTYDESVSGTCLGDSGGPALSLSNERVVGVISRGSEGCDGWSVDGRTASFYTSYIRPYIDGTPIQPLTCDQCFTAATSGQGACVAAVDACFNHPECDALVTCFNGCSTQDCYQQCYDQHPTGYPLYEAIFTCVCEQACTTECQDDSMCQGGTGGTGLGGIGGTAGTGGTGAEGGTAGTGGTGAEGNAPPTGDSWVAGGLENRKYDGSKLGNNCATRPSPGSVGAPWVLWLVGATAFVAWGRRRTSRLA